MEPPPRAGHTRSRCVPCRHLSRRPHGLERFHHTAYLYAFLLGWATSKQDGKTDAAKAFYDVAKRARTRFHLKPDPDDANRMKWTLQEKSDTMADNAAPLVGYKRTIGLAEVQSSLRARGQPHDAASVASLFCTVPWNDDADKITVKVVGQYLRVFSRLSADPAIMYRLDQAESHFNRRHVLAAVTTLDLMCGKTSLPSNTQLQGTLLLWPSKGCWC